LLPRTMAPRRIDSSPEESEIKLFFAPVVDLGSKIKSCEATLVDAISMLIPPQANKSRTEDNGGNEAAQLAFLMRQSKDRLLARGSPRVSRVIPAPGEISKPKIRL
jgi:hypothetical protein